MPAPLIWGGLFVAGLYGFGWAAKETGEAAESMSRLTKYGIVAGGLYVSYRALKSSGALK
ncbi:hypothetical protein WG622_02540 [Cognatishimia sp. D5M38]|uniref:Uncharacterized protein n=1 Tax=Cognatishimia coralii TaxID=3083254 RepID=A0ABU8QCI3_9RHOB